MYIEQEKIEKFNTVLNEHILEDTMSCWVATRLNGASASMACDGNISIPLIRAFDNIKTELKSRGLLK